MADRAKLDKLAELKRAREGGGRSWAQGEDTDLYDGVDGYNDNRMDDWDERDEAVDSDQDDYRSAKCASFPCPPLIHTHPDNAITN